MSAKRIVKRIESGEEPVLASWALDAGTVGEYLREQVRSDRKQAVRHSFILPILFFVILVVQTRAEDFSSVSVFWEYFRFTFGFPFMFFVLVFPLVSFSHWVKRKRVRNAAKAQFGENWLLFGPIFLQWVGDTELKNVYIDEQRSTKVIGFDLSMRPTGRSRIRRVYEVPIPNEHLPEAQALVLHYTGGTSLSA